MKTKIASYLLGYALLGACAAGVSNAQACNWYVAAGGSDANSGAIGSPFATPHRAVQAAQPGNVICLRGGSYRLTSVLGIAKPLTLMSYTGEWAVISADNSSSSSVDTVIAIGADNVTIQDLEVVGGAYYGIKISTDLTGLPPAYVRILRTKVHDTGRDGIKSYMADSLLIEGNEVYNTGIRDSSNAEGIDVMASIPASGDPLNRGVTVRGNYVHHTATYGIYLKGGTRDGWVEGNRVDQTGGPGIALGQDSGSSYMRNGGLYECLDCVAVNNVVSTTNYAGLMCMAGWNVRFENNTAVNVARIGQAAIFSAPNSSGRGCGNAVFRNNALSIVSTRPLVHVIKPSGAHVFDYNGYHSSGGSYSFWLENGANNNYWNFPQWQGAGYDLNSITGPLQVDTDLKPITGSPLIDRGIAIPAVPTDFAGTPRPQGSGYEIGAYEVGLAAPAPQPPPPPPAQAATTTTMKDGTIKGAQKPQKYIVEAQVASAAGSVNGGVVRFTMNGAAIGSATVSNGRAALAYTLKKTVAGSKYTLQAFFDGTASFAPSASNVATLTITP